jgi:hypothetical protein
VPGPLSRIGLGPRPLLLYVDVEIQSIFTTLPASPEPTAFIVHQAKAGPKGLPQLAHHTAMIFGSDGGPRLHALPTSRPRPALGMNRRNQKGTNPHRASFTSSACRTRMPPHRHRVLLVGGSASGADDKFDNDDAGNEEVPMPFLSFSFFLPFLLFIPLPCIWPRANAPWLG